MLTITELYGEPGTGKTHAAHSGWPDPLHVDTAFVQMGFRSMDVHDQGGRGESWPVVAKQYDWDEQTAADHYAYVTEFPQVRQAIETTDRSTIVLDNTADLRALAAKQYCVENNTEWPAKEEWGQINDMVDQVIQLASESHHLVIISQMGDEYQNGEKTGRRVWDGPKRLPYKCDWRIHLVVEEGTRHGYVEKNRFVDQAGDDWIDDVGGSVNLEDLYLVSKIPNQQWEGV